MIPLRIQKTASVIQRDLGIRNPCIRHKGAVTKLYKTARVSRLVISHKLQRGTGESGERGRESPIAVKADDRYQKDCDNNDQNNRDASKQQSGRSRDSASCANRFV